MGRRKEQKPYMHAKEASVTKVPAPADLDCSLEWYLVYTHPRMEAKAARGLTEAGCAVFLPSLRKVVRYKRREMDFRLATFPRYLFAAGLPTLRRDRYLVADDRTTVITINGRPLTDIREIEGVQDIVRAQDKWARVPAKAIAQVVAFQNDAVEPRRDILCPDPKLSPGQTVRIIEGPFMSFLAEVVEQVGLNRAEVMIELFGRPSSLTVDVERLDAA